MANKKDTLKKLKDEFARAGAREVQLRTIGAVLALILSLSVLMMVLGDPLGILAAIGLKEGERRGAYGDCSDPANRNSKICDRSVKKPDKQWKNLRKTHGKSNPFSLSGR